MYSLLGFSETGMHTNFSQKTPVKVESNLKAARKEYNGANNPKKSKKMNDYK